MDTGLRIDFLWNDDHVIAVLVQASNGNFSGVAKAYIGRGGLAEAAATLEGFPRNSSDTRELMFGTLDPNCTDGGIFLKFFCRDLAGHAVLEIRITDQGDVSWWGRPNQSVHMFASVEAAAIDKFVIELRQLESTSTGFVSLRCTQ